MRFLKICKQFKIPRWSTIFSCVFYVLFMSLILFVTFPLKSSSTNSLNRNDVEELSKSDIDSHAKEGEKRKPFGGTKTVIISNSIDGNQLLKTTFHR